MNLTLKDFAIGTVIALAILAFLIALQLIEGAHRRSHNPVKRYLTRSTLEDPYIRGLIHDDRKRRCEVCNRDCICIYVVRVDCPDGIDCAATILKDFNDAVIRDILLRSIWLGINCGCYARFHRQVAHIVDAQKVASKLSAP